MFDSNSRDQGFVVCELLFMIPPTTGRLGQGKIEDNPLCARRRLKYSETLSVQGEDEDLTKLSVCKGKRKIQQNPLYARG